MYCQWRELKLWPSQDEVAYFTPLDFNKNFPKPRVIVDGTEMPIVKPRDPEAQQKTWSTYKNSNTRKVLVGKFPHEEYISKEVMCMCLFFLAESLTGCNWHVDNLTSIAQSETAVFPLLMH